MSSTQRKGSLTNCVVPGCNNNYQNTVGRWPKIRFYSFPSEQERRNVWVKFVSRSNKDGSDWIPSKHSKICSEHFLSGFKTNDENHPSFNPSIHPMKTLPSMRDPKRAQERLARHTKRKILKVESTSTSKKTKLQNASYIFYDESYLQSSSVDVIFSDSVDKSCQTEMVSYDNHLTEFHVEHDLQNVKTQVNHIANQKIDVSVGPSAQIPCFYGFETIIQKLNNINSNDFHRNYLEKLTSIRWPVFEIFIMILNEEQYKPRKALSHKIGNVRIHVERVIMRLKLFKILTNRFPISLLSHSDKIIHICAVIVNLQKPIISSTSELDPEIDDYPEINNLEENDCNICIDNLEHTFT
ncbi:hypothetical protein BLOT_015670, partial [Blomia tropicalis]